jgi:predicted dehydrogenase
MTTVANFAVFGFGYWGPNIVRNIFQIGSDVKYIVDASPVRCKEALAQYPQCTVEGTIDNALKDPDVDAVIIVLPVFLHYSVAKRALVAGKHVLVEKPITSNSAEAEELIELAKKNRLVLMVDHTYLYSSAVKSIKEIYTKRKENINYFDSTRINLGKFQRDVNVVWDLAPHDLAVLDYLVGEKPEKITAVGASHFKEGLEDIAYITIHYNSGAIAHISVSWISPVKIRKILVGGSNTMVCFDDLEKKNKIRIFDTCFKEEGNNVDCWIENESIPELDSTETLSVMLNDFVNCISNGGAPVSNSQIGLDVVKMLEAAQESIKNGGSEVTLNWS